MSVTGEADGMPMKIGVALVDVLTGTNAATAILAAVMHAARTGTGQHIDMSLFDVSVASLANQALNYMVSGTAPGRLGNALLQVANCLSLAVAVDAGTGRPAADSGSQGRPDHHDGRRHPREPR